MILWRGETMNEFELWVLRVLDQIPELQLRIPDIVYTYLDDFCRIVDCFVDLKDYVPLLACSIGFGFVNLSFAVFDYIRSFRR